MQVAPVRVMMAKKSRYLFFVLLAFRAGHGCVCMSVCVGSLTVGNGPENWMEKIFVALVGATDCRFSSDVYVKRMYLLKFLLNIFNNIYNI